jgi:hypothetical protein
MKLSVETVAQEILQLRAAYGDLAGDEELWALTLESETGLKELLSKIERARIEDVNSIKVLDNIAAIYRERAARFERRNEFRRELLLRLLNLANVNKLEIPEATFSIRHIPPAPKVKDKDALPDEACRFKREPDMAKIRELLEQGKPLAGAYMSNGYDTLTIRTT